MHIVTMSVIYVKSFEKIQQKLYFKGVDFTMYVLSDKS